MLKLLSVAPRERSRQSDQNVPCAARCVGNAEPCGGRGGGGGWPGPSASVCLLSGPGNRAH